MLTETERMLIDHFKKDHSEELRKTVIQRAVKPLPSGGGYKAIVCNTINCDQTAHDQKRCAIIPTLRQTQQAETSGFPLQNLRLERKRRHCRRDQRVEEGTDCPERTR